MPTSTAENRKNAHANGAAAERDEERAADQAAEAAAEVRTVSLAAYDACVDAYLAALKVGLQAQARTLELTRRTMGDALSAQDEARELAEQWVSSGRKLQQAWFDAADTTVRNVWAGWSRETR